jgi:hypothetical protein
MSPLRIRRSTRRLRRHAAGLLLVFALGGAVAAHHSGMGAGDMHHGGMSAVAEMCVGAFTAVGATIAACAIGLVALGRWPTPQVLAPAGVLTAVPAAPHPARAGPPPLPLLCVWRR